MFNVDDKAGSPLALSDDIFPPLHPHPEKKRKLRKKVEDGAASYATRREEITDFSDRAFNTLGNHAQSSRCNLSRVSFCFAALCTFDRIVIYKTRRLAVLVATTWQYCASAFRKNHRPDPHEAERGVQVFKRASRAARKLGR